MRKIIGIILFYLLLSEVYSQSKHDSLKIWNHLSADNLCQLSYGEHSSVFWGDGQAFTHFSNPFYSVGLNMNYSFRPEHFGKNLFRNNCSLSFGLTGMQYELNYYLRDYTYYGLAHYSIYKYSQHQITQKIKVISPSLMLRYSRKIKQVMISTGIGFALFYPLKHKLTTVQVYKEWGHYYPTFEKYTVNEEIEIDLHDLRNGAFMVIGELRLGYKINRFTPFINNEFGILEGIGFVKYGVGMNYIFSRK